MRMAQPKINIYCDGSCRPIAPGGGGWAAILEVGGCNSRIELSGSIVERTTAQRMEMLAIVMGLRAVQSPSAITVVADSMCVVSVISQDSLLTKWEQAGWRTGKNRPVANKDLWMELRTLVQQYQVSFVYVKGHGGHPLHGRANALARAALKRAAETMAEAAAEAAAGTDQRNVGGYVGYCPMFL
jgi:ribonuclease HI